VSLETPAHVAAVVLVFPCDSEQQMRSTTSGVYFDGRPRPGRSSAFIVFLTAGFRFGLAAGSGFGFGIDREYL